MDQADTQVVTVPKLETPSGGGAIRSMGEKFSANSANGTGSLSIPLPRSTAREDDAPSLRLTYESGSGNGPFGLGWSLAMPQVSRKTSKGVPSYGDETETDVFLISDAEDLVPVLDAGGMRHLDTATVPGFSIRRYRPRIEGLHARIERWTEHATGMSHWRSISRDGRTMVYGRTENARVSDPDDPRRTSTWHLSHSFDQKGNAQVFEYKAEDAEGIDLGQASEQGRVRGAQRYLKRIRYGNREPNRDPATWDPTDPALLDDFMFEVVLDYGEDHIEAVAPDASQPADAQHERLLASPGHTTAWPARPDSFSTYRNGFEVRTSRRCHRILTFHNFDSLGPAPALVRMIELGYDDLAPAPGLGAETERGHPGSTRLGSKLVSLQECGLVREDGAEVLREGVRYDSYMCRRFPAHSFTYSTAPLSRATERLPLDGFENLPQGVDGRVYRLADIDAEGLPSILTEAGGAWYIRRNLSAAGAVTAGPAESAVTARFGPLERLENTPSSVTLAGNARLIDLEGDGELDVASVEPSGGGFYERSGGAWRNFRTFRQQAVLDWNDPNLRVVDLTGDGRPDILVTGGDALFWREGLGEDGFGREQQVAPGPGEAARLVFSGPREAMMLADMSGDGMQDIVRIAPGSVVYWPNLGRGHFGRPVVMDGAPRLDDPEAFDPGRLRLADIDGTGTTDIVYLSRHGVRIWFNCSGNGFTLPETLHDAPLTDSLAAVTIADLLGTGTGCLVWAASHGGDPDALRYIAMTGGRKSNLLIHTADNFGSETEITYVPSTRHFVEDKLAGRPWLTQLHFPVQVVSTVTVRDRIADNRYTSRFAYHHGAYDGIEREFRGFGMVEHWDTEDISALDDPGTEPAANVDAASNVPPVLTRTWTHLGLFAGRHSLAEAMAGLLSTEDAGEFYRPPGQTDAEARAALLPDSVLPPGLGADEAREAIRALKGRTLRREVYMLDGSDAEQHPLSVEEASHAVRMLQPRGTNRYAVFLPHEAETVAHNHERNPYDPRIRHSLTLETDDFGNVLLQATVAYGRLTPDPSLSPEAQAVQARTLVTATRRGVTNAIDTADDWRVPMKCETRRWELYGLALLPGLTRLTADQIATAADTAPEIDFSDLPGPGLVRRLLSHQITLFRADDLSGALPLGQIETMALPFEGYRLALTQPVVDAAYGLDVSPADLDGPAGYVHPLGDPRWWSPSGRFFYTEDPTHTPSQELDRARTGFFRSRRVRQPLHTPAAPRETILHYDADHFLLTEIVDPLGKRVTAGARDATDAIIADGNDYRVLLPATVCDANRNVVEAAYDALGMTVATARRGKPEEARGDSLAGVVADPTPAQIAAFLLDPHAEAAGLLGSASVRIVPDLFAYARTASNPRPAPVVGGSILRETHVSDLAPGTESEVRLRFEYSDAFGRVVQDTSEAAPGPVPLRETDGTIRIGTDGQPVMSAAPVARRWVCTGWSIFDNKGNVVRRFEPFFNDRHTFEPDIRTGASNITLHDPMSRIVARVHQDHSFEKIVLGAWDQTEWDVGDTVMIADPAADADVGQYLARLDPGAILPTWHQERIGGALGAEAQRAAEFSETYADTPLTRMLDPLGRAFQTTRRNAWRYSNAAPGSAPQTAEHVVRVTIDISGNEREAFDQQDRLVETGVFDMLGARLTSVSMDSGSRRSLSDAAGNRIFTWDANGARMRTVHDVLDRALEVHLSSNGAPEVLIDQRIWGDALPGAEALNQRGQLVEHRDQSGVVRNLEFDQKYNLLTTEREFAAEYRGVLDWSGPVALDGAPLRIGRAFDAIDRMVQETAPDGTEVWAAYNPSKRLERVEVDEPGQARVAVIADIDYDAGGRRTRLEMGCGAVTTWTHDPLTKRVVTQSTDRPASSFPGDGPSGPPALPGDAGLQALAFTYDVSGNVVHQADTAQPLIFFRNRRVDAGKRYVYDALGQILEAEGREHIGQAGGPTTPNSYNDAFASGLAHPGDGNAMSRYLERYTYDLSGNMSEQRHISADPLVAGWTRSFTYTEQSRLEPGRVGNRLSTSTVSGVTSDFGAGGTGYDGNGNMLRMPQLYEMDYDHLNHLSMTQRQAVNPADIAGVAAAGQRTFYRSLTDGTRTRKVTDRAGSGPAPGTRRRERLYFEGYEVYREYQADGATVTLERTAYSVKDGMRRIALIERRTAGSDNSPARLTRYQIPAPLQSVAIELDDVARIVSYEEFTPFGATTYQAVSSLTEVPKRYRFFSRERDEESGLYIIGTRYYASWLCRWTSADPAGLVDGYNLYLYVKNRPTWLVDPSGTQGVLEAGAAGVLSWIAADVAIPEPTDLAWPKWAGYAVAGAIAAGILYVAAEPVAETITEFRGPDPVPLPEAPPIEIPIPPVLPPVEAPPETEPRPQPRPRPRPDPRPEPRPRPRPRPGPPRPIPLDPPTAEGPEIQPRDNPRLRPRPDSTGPSPIPLDPRPDEDTDDDDDGMVRIYVTYTKTDTTTGRVYSGRSSGLAARGSNYLQEAERIVAARDASHHRNDPNLDVAELDQYAVGEAVSYANRYTDAAYYAIRGREQQLIDHHGRAQSEPGGTSLNDIRGVAKDNVFGRAFHHMANYYFGQLHAYTGD